MNTKRQLLTFTFATTAMLTAPPLQAASFTIVDGQTVTSQQILNDNEVGVIEAGGTLSTINISIFLGGGDNIVVTNGGTLTAIGGGNSGIWSTGTNATLTNSGTLTTSSYDSYGIFSGGTNATLTNSGTLTTSGSGAYGIWSSGANATLTQSGILTTSGISAHGIYSGGADATLTNSGTIITSNTNAYGIYSFGTNATLTHSGTLTTSGSGAYGIWSSGANATLTQSGILTTSGISAHGIYSTAADATVNNSGTIQVTGAGTRGIYFTGANATVTNSGTISASGSATEAIVGSANDDVLNLQSGSRIIGTIDLGAGTDTVNISGANYNGALTFTNAEIINVSSSHAIVNGATVAVIDPTQFASEGSALAGVNGQVQQVLQQQLLAPTPLVQLAAIGDITIEPRRFVWGKLFGGNLKRDAEGDALGYKHRTSGAVLGYESSQGMRRMGVMGGVANGDSQVDLASQQSDSRSLYAGLYGQRPLNSRWVINASLLLGSNRHDSQRMVVDSLNGLETATSSYNSWHIAPTVTAVGTYKLTPRWQLHPNVQLGMLWAGLEGYSESGTTSSDLTVANRILSQMSLRGGAEASYMLEQQKGEIAISLGGQYHRTSEGDIYVSLGAGNTTFGLPGEASTTNLYLGGRLRYTLGERITFVGNMELMKGDESGLFASLGLEVDL
jgi:hypothetical protein